MPTNFTIDDDLIAEAVAVGGHTTEKAAIIVALQEYIQRHKQKKLLNCSALLIIKKISNCSARPLSVSCQRAFSWHLFQNIHRCQLKARWHDTDRGRGKWW